MKQKDDDFFWVSLSDLMTSLFFISLVLFVVTTIVLKQKSKGIIAENERLNRILKVEEQFKSLTTDDDFYYLEKCKKFVWKELSGKEIFEPNKAVILDKYKVSSIKAGTKIEEFLKTLHNDNPEFSYIVILEGNMANTWDNRLSPDEINGYRVSYDRALAVYNLWIKNGIDLRKYNSEILISGSGFNGLCRDEIEENNKRFSIQIIPKIEKFKQYEKD